MWQEGRFEFGNDDITYDSITYDIKVYEEPSPYGIKGGKISKLEIRRGKQVLARYDRGWDIKPSEEHAMLALVALMDRNNW